MSLQEYQAKRDFSRTPEPEGEREAISGGRRYVVQKHAARQLHYDFRLELDGVLKSWAVPKGPSLSPGEKRLAVQVEDHPVEYAEFEGAIPEGEYGGGTVIIWDRGAWEPVGDPQKGLEQGKLKFRLHGERLTGAWTLARMGGKASQGGKNWLLIREAGEPAGGAGELTETHTTSVVSGLTLEEIAAGREPIKPDKYGARLENPRK